MVTKLIEIGHLAVELLNDFLDTAKKLSLLNSHLPLFMHWTKIINLSRPKMIKNTTLLKPETILGKALRKKVYCEYVKRLPKNKFLEILNINIFSKWKILLKSENKKLQVGIYIHTFALPLILFVQPLKVNSVLNLQEKIKTWKRI